MKIAVSTMYIYTKKYIKEAMMFVAKRKKMSLSQFINHMFDEYLEKECAKDRHLKERSVVISYRKHKELIDGE